jgi:hypothetical protein
MATRLISILAATGAVLCVGSALAQAHPKQLTAAGCGVKPIETYLALSFEEFDQTRGKGWREITLKDGCDAAATDVIAQYRQAKYGSPEPGKTQDATRTHVETLISHEAQGRAMAGDYARALEKFRWSVAHEKTRPDPNPTERSSTKRG